jgi:hypothetical protein
VTAFDAFVRGRVHMQIQPYRPAPVRGGGGDVYDGNDAAVVWTRQLLRDKGALDAASTQAGNIVGVLLSPPLAAAEDRAIAAGGRTAVTSTELAVLPMGPPLLAADGLMFFEGEPSQGCRHARVGSMQQGNRTHPCHAREQRTFLTWLCWCGGAVVRKEHIADVEALMRHWGYRYVESATWLWQAPTNRLEAQPAPLFRRAHSTLIIGRRGAWDIQRRYLSLPYGRVCVLRCF